MLSAKCWARCLGFCICSQPPAGLASGSPRGRGRHSQARRYGPSLWPPQRRNSSNAKGSEQNQRGWRGLGSSRRRPLTPSPATRAERPLGHRNAHTSLKPWERARGPPRLPRPALASHPSPGLPPSCPPFLWPLHCFRIKSTLGTHTPPSWLLEDKDLPLLSRASRAPAFNHR